MGKTEKENERGERERESERVEGERRKRRKTTSKLLARIQICGIFYRFMHFFFRAGSSFSSASVLSHLFSEYSTKFVERDSTNQPAIVYIYLLVMCMYPYSRRDSRNVTNSKRERRKQYRSNKIK